MLGSIKKEAIWTTWFPKHIYMWFWEPFIYVQKIAINQNKKEKSEI